MGDGDDRQVDVIGNVEDAGVRADTGDRSSGVIDRVDGSDEAHGEQVVEDLVSD